MIDILQDHWLLLLVGQYPHGPLGGLAMTFLMASGALLVALPLSVVLALARTSGRAWLETPVRLLVDLIRCIPLLMLIFWAYFLVPLMTRQPVNGIMVMTIALIVYESAYLSEIIRAGIESTPQGQRDAARALGLGYWPTMRHVVLPQALATMSPSLLTQLNSTIKETSLAYIIGAPELSFAAGQLNSLLMTKPLEVFGILAMLFFLLCGSLSLLAAVLEQRVRGGRPLAVA